MALPQPRAPQSEQDWRSHYQIENPDEVEAYVAEHPIVVPVLAEAPTHISAAFEERPRLILSADSDPDDDPATNFLVVDIMTKRDANEAYDRLERFDESWWLDAGMHVARADAVVVFYPRFE